MADIDEGLKLPEKPCPACGGTGGYQPAYVSFGEVIGPDACHVCQGSGVVPDEDADRIAAIGKEGV